MKNNIFMSPAKAGLIAIVAIMAPPDPPIKQIQMSSSDH